MSYEAIVIGASAGAIGALNIILPVLPHEYPLPIMIVIHLPADKESMLVEIFRAKCKMQVKEAEDKEWLKPGTIYFAPPDYHLLVENDKYLSLSSEEPILFSRPSIDVLFETAADAFGSGLIGIILTGANHDGTSGLQAVIEAGGTALVQDPSDAYAPSMPQAAIAACPQAQILSLSHMAEFLQKAAAL